jgi:hypothetical protein
MARPTDDQDMTIQIPVATAGLLVALLAPAAARAAAPIERPAPQVLAVQTAPSGTLTPVKGAAGTYDLVLRPVASKLDAFDTSPGRRSSRVALPALLRTMFAVRRAPPHNAAITAGGRTMAVALRSGRYDRAKRTVRYRVTKLAGAVALPRRLREPVLLIDGLGGVGCENTLQNNTNYTLNPTDWGDPGDTQRMTSGPGQIPQDGYSDWASAGVTIGAGCSNYAVFESDDSQLTVTLNMSVPWGAFSTPSLSCDLTGPAAPVYACVPNGFTFNDTMMMSVSFTLEMVGA